MSSSKITRTTTLTLQAKGPILPASISSTQNQCGKAPRYLLSLDGLHRGQAHYQDHQQAAGGGMRVQDQELSGSAAQTRPDRRGRPGQCPLESVPLTSGHSTDFTSSKW